MQGVSCYCTSCVHWSENGGDYADEGGCTLDQISISDETLTAAGCLPLCTDYEEG